MHTQTTTSPTQVSRQPDTLANIVYSFNPTLPVPMVAVSTNSVIVMDIKSLISHSADEEGDSTSPASTPEKRPRKEGSRIVIGALTNSSTDSSTNSSVKRQIPPLITTNQRPYSTPLHSPVSSNSTSTSSSATRAHQPVSANYDHNQRRQAHIASEQKRRQSINKGFETLRRIIPECNNSLDSKAMILNKAARYINLLLKENMVLRQRLSSSSYQSVSADLINAANHLEVDTASDDFDDDDELEK